MMLFTRDQARQFRALARRGLSGRPRGPAPDIAVTIRRGVRTIAVAVAEVRLAHSESTAGCETIKFELPMKVLEGRSRDAGDGSSPSNGRAHEEALSTGMTGELLAVANSSCLRWANFLRHPPSRKRPSGCRRGSSRLCTSVAGRALSRCRAMP